jgi:hypothetical protein
LTERQEFSAHIKHTTPTQRRREHFADAERILAALPLVKRGVDRDRDIHIALVHATLSIAASLTPTTEGRTP